MKIPAPSGAEAYLRKVFCAAFGRLARPKVATLVAQSGASRYHATKHLPSPGCESTVCSAAKIGCRPPKAHLSVHHSMAIVNDLSSLSHKVKAHDPVLDAACSEPAARRRSREHHAAVGQDRRQSRLNRTLVPVSMHPTNHTQGPSHMVRDFAVASYLHVTVPASASQAIQSESMQVSAALAICLLYDLASCAEDVGVRLPQQDV